MQLQGLASPAAASVEQGANEICETVSKEMIQMTLAQQFFRSPAQILLNAIQTINRTASYNLALELYSVLALLFPTFCCVLTSACDDWSPAQQTAGGSGTFTTSLSTGRSKNTLRDNFV